MSLKEAIRKIYILIRLVFKFSTFNFEKKSKNLQEWYNEFLYTLVLALQFTLFSFSLYVSNYYYCYYY